MVRIYTITLLIVLFCACSPPMVSDYSAQTLAQEWHTKKRPKNYPQYQWGVPTIFPYYNPEADNPVYAPPVIVAKPLRSYRAFPYYDPEADNPNITEPTYLYVPRSRPYAIPYYNPQADNPIYPPQRLNEKPKSSSNRMFNTPLFTD